MGIYLSQNDQVFNPRNSCPGFCLSTGPVDRARSRSTGSVDRRAQTCTPVWLEGRSTGTVDRPESSALWKGPGRPGGRPDRKSAICIQATVDRPVDRWLNVINLTVGRSTGWSTDRPTWLSTASFSSSINWGFWGLFLSGFLQQFFLLF